MSGTAGFSPRAILAILLAGFGAFLLFLYALGAGWDGSSERDGGAHAASNSLNGFSALHALLERRGYDVALSRNRARLRQPGLVVITPTPFDDGEDIVEAVEARRHVGPTLVILPKWLAVPVPQDSGLNVPRGWVVLVETDAPDWLGQIPGFGDAKAELASQGRWQGLGLSGALPNAKRVLALDGGSLRAWVRDSGGRPLVASRQTEDDVQPLFIVSEPDLMNNYGLADPARAQLALAIVEQARGEEDGPVVLDLTIAGLGGSRNLLTLAFEPPFLAATLCLLLAILVVAWRSLRRFGPPVAEEPEFALGKRQLAHNGAGLIERARRMNLLGPPYAALLAARIASRLGIRDTRPEGRDHAVAAALEARGLAADYPARIEALRSARRTGDLLRAASALKQIERTLAA